MQLGAMGRLYDDGQAIMMQGDVGDCMYVVQSGTVEVVAHGPAGDMRLATLSTGDVFGEMAMFDNAARSATVRAVGGARILTVDRKTFLRRVHEDPSLAWRVLQRMSTRIRALNAEVVRLRTGSTRSSS